MEITDENLKPIPKYIAALIQRTDEKAYPKPCGSARFYAYLTKMQGELVKVTVAVKHHRGDGTANKSHGTASVPKNAS